MPPNHGAFITSPNDPIRVLPMPYPTPTDNQLVIRNRATAINPIDWLQPHLSPLVFPWLKAPYIMGFDVAGEVISVGPSVTRFKPGDRVLGFAVGTDKRRNRSAESGFVEFPVLLEYLTSEIPEGLSFERACVLPLGLSTAAIGLFEEKGLGLRRPVVPARPSGEWVVVWGGSTSVGSCGVQLAVAAGYEVVTTASRRNFEYCRGLGAREVFDYNDGDVVEKVVAALEGKICAGALTIGNGAAEACLEILSRVEGKKVIAMASMPMPDPRPESLIVLRTVMHFLPRAIVNSVKARARGIRTMTIMGSDTIDDGLGPAIFEDFLPKALAAGTFECKPDPQVVGTGLESIQEAFEIQKKGVSAKKIVVAL